MTTPVPTLFSADVTNALHDLVTRQRRPLTDVNARPMQALTEAGLARLDNEQLVATPPDRRAEILRSAVDAWLPGVFDVTGLNGVDAA